MANLFYDTLKVLLDNITLVRLEKFYSVTSKNKRNTCMGNNIGTG